MNNIKNTVKETFIVFTTENDIIKELGEYLNTSNHRNARLIYTAKTNSGMFLYIVRIDGLDIDYATAIYKRYGPQFLAVEKNSVGAQNLAYKEQIYPTKKGQKNIKLYFPV